MSLPNEQQAPNLQEMFDTIAVMLKTRYPIFCSVFAPQEEFHREEPEKITERFQEIDFNNDDFDIQEFPTEYHNDDSFEIDFD